mgnify:CR=1 FL=1
MQEGRASPSQVDAVMRDTCGFRMGPFELMDLTGIDVNFPARKIIYEGFFHDRRMTPSPYHESLYAAGRLGRKTGGGWYAYDAKGAKVDPGADHAAIGRAGRRASWSWTATTTKLTGLLGGDGASMLGADDGKSPILVAPIGKDCTTTAIELRASIPGAPSRSTSTGDTGKRLTVMTAPGADRAVRDAAVATARQVRHQGDGDQGLARLHRPAHVRDDRQSRLRDGDDRHRLGAGRRHRDDARPQLPARAAGAGRLAGREGVPRDPGADAGHHRRRPLPAEPVAAAAGAVGLERDSAGLRNSRRVGSPLRGEISEELARGACPHIERRMIMSTGTVRFHRVLTAPPERVYRAFLDADAMAKWLPPHGFTGHVHKMDARVGGSYRMSFTNFSSGKSHAFGGTYLELVPHERLRYTATFDDPNLPGEMQTTIILKKVSVGTEIDIVQEGIPAVIPPEACCLGWQESLTLLAQLAQPEIPG